jgi:hypothetical protein
VCSSSAAAILKSFIVTSILNPDEVLSFNFSSLIPKSRSLNLESMSSEFLKDYFRVLHVSSFLQIQNRVVKWVFQELYLFHLRGNFDIFTRSLPLVVYAALSGKF